MQNTVVIVKKKTNDTYLVSFSGVIQNKEKMRALVDYSGTVIVLSGKKEIMKFDFMIDEVLPMRMKELEGSKEMKKSELDAFLLGTKTGLPSEPGADREGIYQLQESDTRIVQKDYRYVDIVNILGRGLNEKEN